MTIVNLVRATSNNGDAIEAEVTDSRGVIMVELRGGAWLDRDQWETFAQEVSQQVSKLVQKGTHHAPK